jgi:hypothetical protein
MFKSSIKLLTYLDTVVASIILLALVACGSSNSANNQSNNQTPPAPQFSTVQVNVGDSPSDRVIAFSTNISSMVLNNSNGSTTPVVSPSTPLEMMRLAGTMQPLNVLSIPQGTYTGASVTLSSISVTFMDPITRTITQKTIAGPITTNVPFSPNLSLGSTPIVLSFDMNMASSIAIDNSDNVTVTPTFQVVMNSVGTGNGHDPENGMMEHLIGSVASVSGSNFGFLMMQSAQVLNFSTTGNTQFQNIGGMGMMSNGALIMVDAMLQSDGTVQAQNVDWFAGNGGVIGSGIVGSVTGNPATQMGMVVQNGSGQGMMSSFFSNNATVNLTGSTSFNIDTDGMDMSNLPFTPMFDADHIYSGERVRCMSNGGMGSEGMGGMGGMGGGGVMGTMNANQCGLVQQGLTGTVSNYSASGGQATFTLTLLPDSYFAIMTRANTITVYQQPATEMYGITSISNGQTVLVRGLMFDDGGVFRMVARRIMNP